MHSFSIPVQKTAFCATAGDAEKPAHVWFVLHGYGQLASYFIRHFEPVAGGDTVVAAPEAPSRFYLDGTYGRVGACWMTKHERETDIADLNAYLDRMFGEVSRRCGADGSTKFHFLAFSQGVPVLCRWLARRADIPVHRLVLWAGAVPHDMPAQELDRLLRRGRSYIVFGTEDPFLKEPQFPMLQTVLNEMQLPVETKTFAGGHTLDRELLLELKNNG